MLLEIAFICLASIGGFVHHRRVVNRLKSKARLALKRQADQYQQRLQGAHAQITAQRTELEYIKQQAEKPAKKPAVVRQVDVARADLGRFVDTPGVFISPRGREWADTDVSQEVR